MSIKKFKVIVTILSLAASASLFASATASTGHGEKSDHGNESAHGDELGVDFGQLGQASAVTRTVNINMYDNYYDVESVDVKEGETIRFNITNKAVLVHEFNIAPPEAHKNHQKEMLMMLKHGIIKGNKLNRKLMSMKMANGESMDHNDPNSVLLEPGESSEIIWKFDEKTQIEFACNIPGHYQSGMVGKINF